MLLAYYFPDLVRPPWWRASLRDALRTRSSERYAGQCFHS